MSDKTQATGDESISSAESAGLQDTAGNEKLAAGEGEEAKAFDTSLLDKVGNKPNEAQALPTEQTLPQEAKIQLDKWRTRVLSEDEDNDGLQYSLDHPKMPVWVKKILKKDPIIGAQEEPAKAPTDTKDVEKNIREQLEYEDILGQLKGMRMSSRKQEEIMQEVEDLVSDGVPKLKAVKKALKLAQIEVKAYDAGLNRALRSLPPDGEPVKIKPDIKFAKTAIDTGKTLFGISPEDWKKYGSKIN